MVNHYYNTNLETKSNKKSMRVQLLTREIILFTDHGVFSKEGVDYGTRVLLKHIVVKDNYKRILDLGCGYGPVGISLAKEFSFLEIDMVDINLRAIELAKEAAKVNNLQNVYVFESNIYKNINNKYDCIITNPPIRAGKLVVHEILTDSINYLEHGGTIYVVVQKKQGAPSAKAKLEEAYGNCEIVAKDKGYYILKSEKKM